VRNDSPTTGWSEWEPAKSVTDRWSVIGGWLPSLTLTLCNSTYANSGNGTNQAIKTK